jgi:hypothetical protein
MSPAMAIGFSAYSVSQFQILFTEPAAMTESYIGIERVSFSDVGECLRHGWYFGGNQAFEDWELAMERRSCKTSLK